MFILSPQWFTLVEPNKLTLTSIFLKMQNLFCMDQHHKNNHKHFFIAYQWVWSRYLRGWRPSLNGRSMDNLFLNRVITPEADKTRGKGS